MKVSKAFEAFQKEAQAFQKPWINLVTQLEEATALDKKTAALSYLAVLAATRLEGGLPFHTKLAKKHGATKEEVISAVLIGLPAVGNTVIQALPIVIDAYDE